MTTPSEAYNAIFNINNQHHCIGADEEYEVRTFTTALCCEYLRRYGATFDVANNLHRAHCREILGYINNSLTEGARTEVRSALNASASVDYIAQIAAKAWAGIDVERAAAGLGPYSSPGTATR